MNEEARLARGGFCWPSPATLVVAMATSLWMGINGCAKPGTPPPQAVAAVDSPPADRPAVPAAGDTPQADRASELGPKKAGDTPAPTPDQPPSNTTSENSPHGDATTSETKSAVEQEASQEPTKEIRRTPAARRADGQPIPITFDDLNLRIQQDIVFRPWMLNDRVQELNGQRVRISGYIHAGVTQRDKIKEFVLLRNTECKFGPGGQADHLVKVKMEGAATAHYTIRPVQVEGIIEIDPFEGPDGNTWSIYTMHATTYKELRGKE